jgi:probable HAF family extracellular repeat protein
MVSFRSKIKMSTVAIAVAIAVVAFTAHVAGASARGPIGDSISPRTPIPAFVLDRGRYTSYDHPGARLETSATGINNRGQITGSYVDEDAVYHGYLRDRRGRLTNVDLPRAVATAPAGINNRGQIVGRYYESAPIRGPDARFRGYLQDGRKLIRIDVPGALQTQAVDINNRGQVVGEYLDTDGTFHGFLWRKGRFTTIDYPGAAGSSLTGINDSGEIVGAHADSPTAGLHGFVLKRGRFTSFDAPGVPITIPMDINNRGQIVGNTILDADLTGGRGFLLARGVGGGFSPIDYPGAPRTFAFGINDRRAIIGTYENTRATSTPPPPGEQTMGLSPGGGAF